MEILKIWACEGLNRRGDTCCEHLAQVKVANKKYPYATSETHTIYTIWVAVTTFYVDEHPELFPIVTEIPEGTSRGCTFLSRFIREELSQDYLFTSMPTSGKYPYIIERGKPCWGKPRNSIQYYYEWPRVIYDGIEKPWC